MRSHDAPAQGRAGGDRESRESVMKLLHPLVYLLVNRQTPVPEVLLYVRHVVTSLTGNTWVPATTVALTTVSSDADALQTAQTAALSKGLGLAEARNHK